MKLQSILICLYFLSTTVYAQSDKNCEAAVDAAASMNMNQPECDYSDKGLNGYLKRAFKKGEEGATLATDDPKATANENKIREDGNKLESSELKKSKPEKNSIKNFLLNAEAVQWADTSVVRTQLLAKAMEECGKGFMITEEAYRALAGGKLKLTMRFECVSD